MSEIKLSFCIPTYNRANYIDQTISSIADQIIEGNWCDCIEICISDNASTDGTDDVIFDLQSKYPSVKLLHSKNSVNLGADRNYLLAVEMANGKYCWLFGSDDTLTPRSVERMMSEIDQDLDIYLCNRFNCDVNLKPIEKFSGLKISNDRIFDFSHQNEIVDYLNSAQSIYALFSYLSSIVVKKSQWDTVKYDNEMTGTAYSHAYVLVALLLNSVKLKYIQNALVFCRLGNDSFALDGAHNRFMIDFKGYLKIAHKLFENKDLKVLFISILRRQHPWYKLIKLRYFNKLQWNQDKKYFLSTGYSRFAILTVEVISSVPYLCEFLLKLNRINLKSTNQLKPD